MKILIIYLLNIKTEFLKVIVHTEHKTYMDNWNWQSDLKLKIFKQIINITLLYKSGLLSKCPLPIITYLESE